MTSVLVVLTAELVSNPAAIKEIQSQFTNKDVHQQLLERIEVDAIKLPNNKYHEIFICGGDLGMTSANHLFETMTSDGKLFGNITPSSKSLLLISGFVESDGTWIKPQTQQASVSLRKPTKSTQPKKLFAKASDLIDEDDLIEEDTPTFQIPEKCQPADGTRRRKACKDCTCGLKDAENEEDAVQRKKQNAVLLTHDEIAEIDFTVPGKAVGGCGSCSLGDAFRCDGCPYIGLPPFKPGEAVSIDQMGDDL